MAQPIKKGQTIKKRTTISSIKNKLGLGQEAHKDLATSSADKPMEWIIMPNAFQDALKLNGFPMGYCSVISGWSNTGKSTLKNCLIAACQRQGILPVIYETENNFDFKYAIDCGMQATPIYGDVEVEDVDEETGEVSVHTENRIIDYDGDFIYYDSSILAEMYGDMDYSSGKRVSKKRKIAVIEDIAYSMNEILDLQDEGEIQQPVCFIWDSVGSIPSFKSVVSKTGNNMFDAGAISVAFNTLLNNRIPASRRINNPYTNTFVCVNKIWNDSMNSMGGLPSIELKGGKSIFFAARLILHLGGAAKASTKKLSATAKGQTYDYGVVTKVKCTKNQLPTPYNVTYNGTFCCLHNGIYTEGEVDDYKKTYMKDLLKQIEERGNISVNEKDVEFTETESED